MKPDDLVIICVPHLEWNPGITAAIAKAIPETILITDAFLRRECRDYEKLAGTLLEAEEKGKLPLVVPYTKDKDPGDPESNLPNLSVPRMKRDFDAGPIEAPSFSKSQRMKPEKPRLDRSDRNWKKFHR